MSLYEESPLFVRVAYYMRNREYTSEIVRTPTTLARCCDYLMHTIMPLVDDRKVSKLDTL
jgi:hypothetical protein